MEFKYYAALSEKIAALQNPAHLQLNELLNEIAFQHHRLIIKNTDFPGVLSTFH